MKIASTPTPVTAAPTAPPEKPDHEKAPRTAGSKRAGMLIEIVSTPTMKSGTDRELCFATISSAEGRLTVAKCLELPAPKCRKPRNASWYLGAFVSERLVKLVEPSTKA